MKRAEYFKLITSVFRFKAVLDEEGNEYVILEENDIDSLTKKIEDKTEFEAVLNHVHLLDNIKKNEFDELVTVGTELGQILMDNLKFHYPDKSFVVFVTISINDSMIIRFHQKWKDEEPYYDPADFISERERVLMFEA